MGIGLKDAQDWDDWRLVNNWLTKVYLENLYLIIGRYYGGNPKLRNGATYGAEILHADPYPTVQDMGWV